MNWILKNKNLPSETSLGGGFAENKNISQGKKSKALLVVFFLVGFFLFFSVSNAKAAPGICENTGGNEKTCECFSGSTSLGAFPAGQDISAMNSSLTTGFCSQESCMQFCKFKFPTATAVKYDGGTLGTSSISNSSSSVVKAPTASDALKGLVDNIFVKAVKYILIQVLSFCGWLFAIATTLFAWAIEPKNISGTTGLLNKQAVKDVWIMVRDTLNMAFILVLLFAAFCTIFQIDKWNLKKVWLNILINALLVNFSYPIARFFIDVSNVAFYYFVNHLFTSTTTVTGSSIFSSLSASSKIGPLLAPENYQQYDIAYIIAMIVVVFIMGMTVLIVAALFVVRLVALTMLVMFSPIGFVGYIFPATTSFADKWWKQLFSYSFFAPIMIFIMAISIRITTVMGDENFQSFTSNANANSPAGQANWIANAAFFAIPVIILWTGMGVAKSMGIAGADTVVGAVKKGGKWLANRPNWAWRKTGIPGGVKKGYEKATKTGELFGSKKLGWILKNGQPDREEKWAGAFGGGKKGWDKAKTNIKETANKEEIEKGSKGHIDSGATADSMAAMMNDMNLNEMKRAQAAHAYQKFDFDDRKAHTMSTITTAGVGSYGDHHDALTGAIHPSMGPNGAAQQLAARTIADQIKAGGHVNADKHRQLASYLNKHAKTRVVDGVKS